MSELVVGSMSVRDSDLVLVSADSMSTDKSLVTVQSKSLLPPVKKVHWAKEVSEMDSSVVQSKTLSGLKDKVPVAKETDAARMVTRRWDPELLCGYPKGAFFCLGSEFAERFSFYGMRSILTMYMKNIHKMEDSQAKLVYHAFVSLSYFTPLIGSLLADGYLGRYRVILYITILYCVGHVVLTVAAVPQVSHGTTTFLDFIGLFIIAFGTGGIKPCVSSFSADQFPPTMVAKRKRFGSFFYLSITLGSLLSEFVTPQLSYLNCLGRDTCYPLAFGLPAIFVFIGLAVLVMGKRYYHIVQLLQNTFVQVVKCTCYAMKRCCCRCYQGFWLNLAKEKYDEQLVEDVKSLCHIFLLFVPAISFWALFDQQGSSWVIQASKMDGHFGYVTVRPDQLTVLNPLFIVIMVPITALLIYPQLWKRNILVRPLRRMGYGCGFAVLSFVVAGIVHLFINKTLIVKPDEGKVRLVIVNTDVCGIMEGNETLVAASSYIMKDVPISYDGILREHCSEAEEDVYLDITFNLTQSNGKGHILVIWIDDNSTQLSFALKKPDKGRGMFYAILHPDLIRSNASVLLSQTDVPQDPDRILTADKTHIEVAPYFFGTPYLNIQLRVGCSSNDTKCNETTRLLLSNIYIQNGGVYCLVVEKGNSSQFITLVPSNSVSMAWMIPQYFLITLGEVLFAISGGEFSYGQAVSTMKSTVLSCWLMSVAFGNVIDMVVSGTNILDNAAVEYFVYAGLMLVCTVIFVYLANRYKYIERDTMEIAKKDKMALAKRKKVTSKIPSKKSKKSKSEKQSFPEILDAS